MLPASRPSAPVPPRRLVGPVALVGVAVLAGSLLAGCSGSPDGDAGEVVGPTLRVPDGPRLGTKDDFGYDTPAYAGAPCAVDVRLSGEVTDSWEGEGIVDTRTDDARAVYQTKKGDTVLTLYSDDGRGFAQNLLLNVGRRLYGASADRPGLDIDADGASARVDVVAASPAVAARTVRVDATFTC